MLEYSITEAGNWILFSKALREMETDVALGKKWRILTLTGCCVWLRIFPQKSPKILKVSGQ